MSSGFDSSLPQAKEALGRLQNTSPKPVQEADIPDKLAGIYVFYEGGKPLRVGTSRNLRQRIKQHYGSSHRSAAFAKSLARKKLKVPGGTRPGEGWKSQLDKFPKLRDEFQKARKRVRKMSVVWLEVPDADCRYLLEFYAAKELRTPHNDFSET